MKKSLLVFVLAFLVLAGIGVWAVYGLKGEPAEWLMIAGAVIVVAFAVYRGVKYFRSEEKGEPVEDELSRKVLDKASSRAFYISIYLWLVLMYYSDRISWETHTLIGAGIMGMALLFAASWVFYFIKGIRE